MLIPVSAVTHQPISVGGELFENKLNGYMWKIDRGSSHGVVFKQLYNAGLVNSPDIVKIFARLLGQTTVQAGTYWIEEGDTALSLLSKFYHGEVMINKVTFPEGWNFSQWREHLSSISQFSDSQRLSDQELLEVAGITLDHPEGWFFPDTYNYTSIDKAPDILRRAHRQMQNVLKEEWIGRADGLPYEDAYEALIMASIVEKETGLARERAAIAGVFVKRLRRGMRLETDPTVIYGLGKEFDGNLRRSHLRQKTTYNTYVIRGLPPTPIAMPSRAAIQAALNPISAESLYFVSKGDGSHFFSSSYEEHKKAVEKYQLMKRPGK
ncbi:MAG: endolytic transglycosylase MltG [Cellvibrionales bacterium TMED148]|nr:BCR, YceG family protein [Porticoccaceae bacterium]RPG89213.1 MAG: endolytic transglycosylase MltG [Cellvibrionales bacterium TMED148]